MLFTREPIIETVITARNGYRLCVRNSKSPVEELLVDALEIVSFGQALFFRCVERPKAFLLPVSDYEVSEVRETRLVLKHMAQEGRKNSEPSANRPSPKQEVRQEEVRSHEESSSESSEGKDSSASRSDRRRERRRQRRRKGDSRAESNGSAENESQDDDLEGDSVAESSQESVTEAPVQVAQETVTQENTGSRRGSRSRGAMQLVSALIPPPPTLVSDLFRYEHLDNEGVHKAAESGEQQIQNVRHEFVDALQTRGEITPLL